MSVDDSVRVRRSMRLAIPPGTADVDACGSVCSPGFICCRDSFSGDEEETRRSFCGIDSASDDSDLCFMPAALTGRGREADAPEITSV